MAESFIQLPGDGSGKKTRSRNRTVSGNSIHEQYVIPVENRILSGVYHVASAKTASTGSAHGATAGYFWLINPVGSAVLVSLRRVEFQHLNAGIADPETTLELVTFTGTASGAQLTAAKTRSTYGAPSATFRTASTGLTLTAGAKIRRWNASTEATGTDSSDYYEPLVTTSWEPHEDERPVLGAGEGLVWRGDIGGSGMSFSVNLTFDEFTD